MEGFDQLERLLGEIKQMVSGAITRTAAFQAGVDKLIVSRQQARGMS